MTIGIIDYQMGNLRSVQNAFKRVGHEAIVSSDPAELAAASHLVLPGVGAFADAVAELKRRDLHTVIRDAIDAGTPFLGICIGLQVLFEVGYEDGEHEGLGILKGKVVKFTPEDASLKVPHMGWNIVRKRLDTPLLADTPEGAYFYFVHSYYPVPDDPAIVALESEYPDPFCAMVWKDNLFATQFHPEKSQANGLRLLDNFGAMETAGVER